MKPAENIEKLIKKARFKATNQTYQSTLNSFLQGVEDYKKQKPAPTQPNIWRIIMKNKMTKFAVAAGIVIAVLVGINQFDSSIDLAKPAYGITDVPELFQAARTIHMKGRMYFPLSEPGKKQSSVEVEYWLDTQNGRWRLTYPGYSSNGEAIKIHVSENISDGEYIMHINHTNKTVSFSKLSPFQLRLFTHKNRYTFFELMYINFDRFDYTKVGREVIDGATFDIWEGIAKGNLCGELKAKAWLSPTTGNFARIKTWSRQEDGGMAKRMEIDLVQRDIEIPDEIFLTEAPPAYVLENTKDTATERELSNASVGNDSVTFNCHIVFTMAADGSVIVGWSSEDRQSDQLQAILFEDLEIGGPLPKLAAEVYAIKPITTDEAVTYQGYHLAYTQKAGKFYEWSIYVPEQKTAPEDVMGYHLVHRYNPQGREINAELSIAVAAELEIQDAEDFAVFVRGAMADLSDNGYVPEHVTYENVLGLIDEIKGAIAQ